MGFAPDGARRFKPSSSGPEEARLWHSSQPSWSHLGIRDRKRADGGIGILVGNNIFPFCGRAAVHTVLWQYRTPKAPPPQEQPKEKSRILALTRKQIEL